MTHPSPLLTAAFGAAVSVLLISASATAQGFKWVKTVDEALEQAKTENKVVLFAINLEGERANDELVRRHYQDPLLRKLSSNIICVFCSAFTGRPATAKTGLHTNANKNNERIVRSRFLKADSDQWIVAPQHVFVGPDGKILSSVSYRVTKGELEWMIVHAIRQVDPGFEWQASGAYRAPADMRKGQADDAEGQEPPPTAAQVREALENIARGTTRGGGRGRRGRNNWERLLADAETIIHSDRPEALKWGKAALRNRWTGKRLMKIVGEKSPQVWSKVVSEHVANNDADMRLAAVIALEQLGDPKSLSCLKTGFKKEKELDVQGRMLRAMAKVAPANKQAILLVQKALKSHKSEFVRAHATVAVGLLENRAAVTEGLRRALQDSSGLVRSVAAYVIAIRQDKEMLQHLQFSLKAESAADLRRWMRDAVTAIQTGDTKTFKNFLKDTLDNKDVAREALGEPRRGRRGRGRGDGEDGQGEGSGRDGGGRRRGRDRGRRGRDRGKGEDDGGKRGR